MTFAKTLRYWYEARLKASRDRYGEDEYIWDLGRAEGKVEGKAEDVLELLNELGEIPDTLKDRIPDEFVRNDNGRFSLRLFCQYVNSGENMAKIYDICFEFPHFLT